MGRLTQSTEEIQSILDSVQDKADKADVVQPDWDATRGKAAVKNRPFGFNNPIRLSDADEIIDEVIDPDYDTHKITYKFLNYQFEGGLLMYVKGLLYDYNYEYEDYYYNRLYSGDDFRVRDFGDSAIIEVVFDGYNYDHDNYETIITITRENFYDDVRAAIEEDVILAVDEVALRTSLPDIFIPDSIARQESVLELYEEASLLWGETTSLWEETVSLNGEVSDIKGRVDNLESRGSFDTKGVYPDLIAGDLAGHGESVPAEFSFRASGGKSIKDGRAYIKSIKGNSVVWNQYATQTNAINREADYYPIFNHHTSAKEHKYLVRFDDLDDMTNQWLIVGADINGNYSYLAPSMPSGRMKYIIFSMSDLEGQIYVRAISSLNPSQINVANIQFIDLTQMFGAGNEPTTIEEYNARKPIVEDEYAYNEGEVIHMNTESIKSVGDNAYNKDRAMQGTTNDNTGEFIVGEYATMVDLMACLPNTQYYFANVISYYHRACVHYYDANMNYIGLDGINGSATDYLTSGILMTPANARFMRVGTYVNATEPCMVTLVHSGWKQDTDAGYQPYWEDTLPLPIIRKYFPQGMKKAGSACDEIRFNKSSGKWEKVVGIDSVDMGTLNWYHDASLGGFYSDILVGANKLFDGICAKYPFVGDYRNVTDKTCGYVYESCVLVKDSSYTDAASFKESLQGVMLYYESNDWEWVELDAEDQNFRYDYRVADFGTEQAISSVPSAPFSADIIYQFNAVDMIRENYNEIKKLKEMLNLMQAQLISLTNK